MPVSAAQVMIVPVDVVALCVGETDAEAVNGFAGATARYDTLAGVFRGADASISFDHGPLRQLEKGVHLHWALPDALTRADAPRVPRGQSGFEFPAAPNCWFVTRVVIGPAPALRSWVVESDALSETPATGCGLVTVAVQASDATGVGYRFLGKRTAVEAYAPPPPEQRLFKTATGRELTAVANGMPHFAAYYPDARASFGFYDDLADVPATEAQPVSIMYVVTGWFDHQDNDPAKPAVTMAMLQRTLRWLAQTDEDPARTLYSGLVQGVTWGRSVYIYQQPAQNPIQAEVAIGNNPAEALAAFCGAKAKPGDAAFEQLLNALPFGLLDRFVQPLGDRLANLRESLHEKEFVAVDAGTIHVVTNVPPAGPLQASDPPPALPLKLADDLNRLNIAQQQYDLYRAKLAELAWQLFSDWYHNEPPASLSTAERRFQAYQQLVAAGPPLQQALAAAIAVVDAALGDDFVRKTLPAGRYWQPTEPSVLIAAADLAFPARYGGDAAGGHLACRMGDQLVTGVTAGGLSVQAAAFAPLTQGLVSTAVPHPDVCAALIAEACLLNTAMLAASTGQAEAALRAGIVALLQNPSTDAVRVTGTPPSPVAMTWWDANPWLPIFLHWKTRLASLQETETAGKLADYPAEFFTANFKIDSTQSGFVEYSAAKPVQPLQAHYDDSASGWSILSPIAAGHFADGLSDFIGRYGDKDGTLGKAQQALAAPVMVQSLNGFTLSLLQRQQTLQTRITADAATRTAYPAYAQFTDYLRQTLGGDSGLRSSPTNPIMTAGSYNAIRTGHLIVDSQSSGVPGVDTFFLEAVDAFGQRRRIQFPVMSCAAALTSAASSIAFLPPRLAQPARLLFRWIAADSAALDEMNAHPATSPVCGWLLPDHLALGFFLYDQQGKPLGHLGLNGQQTEIDWQSAPGDDATINEAIDGVLAHAHPLLHALGMALNNNGVDFFKAFWTAVDSVHGTINPANLATNGGLGVLIGRPVALVQTLLRLEVKGAPALDQSEDCYQDGTHIDAEHAFTAVRFPVLLGDLKQWDDGLIGYFKTGDQGYDLRTFYTQGADAGATSGVVQPDQQTLTLSVTPKPGAPAAPDFVPDTIKLLLLADPRARVHATTGIVPTQVLEIPPDQAVDALSRLEISFPVTPVLKGSSGLAFPTPSEAGFELSFVEQVGTSERPQWAVMPEIDAPQPGGVWTYTPQALSEGWLRFTPAVLEFSLLDQAGRPIIPRSGPSPLTIQIVNRKPGQPIRFTPGQLVLEGQDPGGSVFYIHLGKLVAQDNVAKLTLALDGWHFACLSDAIYGRYWAATPAQPAALARGQPLSIGVSGLMTTDDASVTQGNVYFDYYDLEGLGDGVYAELVAIA
jgi:hypothetical protein